MSRYRWDDWWPVFMSAAVAVTLLTVGVFTLATLTTIAAISSASPATFFATPFDPTVLGLPFLYLFMACALWYAAFRRFNHARRRARALADDTGAMPLAYALASPSWSTVGAAEIGATAAPGTLDTTPLADAPIRLSWLDRSGERATSVFAGAGGLTIPLAAFFFGIVGGAVFDGALAGLLIALGVFAVGFALYGVILRRRIATQRATAGQPTTLVADGVGLTWRRPRRGDVSIRWEDARLLETWTALIGVAALRVYRLYDGGGARITWPQFTRDARPSRYFAPVDVSMQELAQRQQWLLALIRSHTALAPRSLDPNLTTAHEKAPPTVLTVWGAFGGLLAFFVFGVLSLIATPFVIFLPLTHFAPVNWYAAFTLGMTGVGYLSYRMRAFILRRHRRARQSGAASAYPLPDPPASATTQFVLVEHRPDRERLLSGLIGVLGLLDGVVVALGFAAAGHRYPVGTLGFNLVSVVMWPLLLIAVVSLCLLSYDTLRPAIVLYGASSEGLAMRRNIRIMRIIRWRDIAYVAAIQRGGVVTSFEASATNGQRIAWPATTPQPAIRHPALDHPALDHSALDHSARVTPDELAALVVARTGLALQAREA